MVVGLYMMLGIVTVLPSIKDWASVKASELSDKQWVYLLIPILWMCVGIYIAVVTTLKGNKPWIRYNEQELAWIKESESKNKWLKKVLPKKWADWLKAH